MFHRRHARGSRRRSSGYRFGNGFLGRAVAGLSAQATPSDALDLNAHGGWLVSKLRIRKTGERYLDAAHDRPGYRQRYAPRSLTVFEMPSSVSEDIVYGILDVVIHIRGYR